MNFSSSSCESTNFNGLKTPALGIMLFTLDENKRVQASTRANWLRDGTPGILQVFLFKQSYQLVEFAGPAYGGCSQHQGIQVVAQW